MFCLQTASPNLNANICALTWKMVFFKFYLCWGFYVLISTARKIFESGVTVVSKSADYKKLGHESTSHHKISLYLDKKIKKKKLNETLKKDKLIKIN